VQQHHARLAGTLKSSLKDVQDDAIIGVHAPGTNAQRQGIPTILNAIILMDSRAARLDAVAGRQNLVRGKKAQPLQEMPSRKWTVSHVLWIPLLCPIAVCQLTGAREQSWSEAMLKNELPVQANHTQFWRVPMTA
jgi:hypothetical protein